MACIILYSILSVKAFFNVFIAIVWTISDPFQFQFVKYKVKNGQNYDVFQCMVLLICWLALFLHVKLVFLL